MQIKTHNLTMNGVESPTTALPGPFYFSSRSASSKYLTEMSYRNLNPHASNSRFFITNPIAPSSSFVNLARAHSLSDSFSP